jgi:hypothetical protein
VEPVDCTNETLSSGVETKEEESRIVARFATVVKSEELEQQFYITKA